MYFKKNTIRLPKLVMYRNFFKFSFLFLIKPRRFEIQNIK